LSIIEGGDASGDLNDRLSYLLHFKLDDELLKVASGAITLLLNDQLTFRLAIALNFAFKSIGAINHLSLNSG